MRFLIFKFILLSFLFSCAKNHQYTGKPSLHSSSCQKFKSELLSRENQARLVSTDHFMGQDKEKVYHFKWPNGLSLLAYPNTNTKTITYQSWVKVGSRHEIIGKTGIAHLLEHLMFKGTKTSPAGTFDRRLERMGASTNAGTWVDWTYYYESFPSKYLPEVVALEADRYTNLLLTKEQVKTEIEVVKNELRQRYENRPNGKLSLIFQDFMFPGSPYQRPTIGFKRDLNKLNQDDISSFYKKYYSPNNLTLVLVGNFDLHDALNLIDKNYSSLKPSSQNNFSFPQIKKQTQERHKSVHIKTLPTNKALLGYSVPGLGHLDRVAIDTLLELLLNPSSQLYKKYVEQNKLFKSISYWVTPWEGKGFAEIEISFREQGIFKHELLNQFKSDFSKAMSNIKLKTKQFSSVKNQILASYIRGVKTNHSKARILGNFHSTLGDYRLLSKIPSKYESLRLIDLIRVRDLYFKDFQRSNLTVTSGAQK